MQIKKTVIEVVQEVVDTFPVNDRFKVNSETILFGANAPIDSMTLVSIIVELEEMLSDEFDRTISLTDDNAMTREISPFDTVQTLVDYINELTIK